MTVPGNSPGNQENWLDRSDNRRRTHWSRRPSPRERSREDTIREWYGGDEAILEIVAHQTPGKHISETIGDLLASFGMKEAILLDRLREAWPDIVTPDIAQACSPSGIRDETLLIEVDHATWLSTLKQQYSDVVAERVKEFSAGKIGDIRFVPGGRTQSSRRRYYPGRKPGAEAADPGTQDSTGSKQRTRHGRDRFKRRA